MSKNAVVEQSIAIDGYEIRAVSDNLGQWVEMISGPQLVDTETLSQNEPMGRLLTMLLRHGVPAMKGLPEAAGFRLTGESVACGYVEGLKDQLIRAKKKAGK